MRLAGRAGLERKPRCDRRGVRSQSKLAPSGRSSMRVRLQKDLVLVSPEETELEKLDGWLRTHAGQVFRLESAGDAAVLRAIGPEDEACRKPINISSRSPMPLR